ncbi:NUDIX domain-containing protein [Amycolatopsis sp. CA-161197]|uniref:NUDIX domain-containing protein n=1 Tax=Amycolatopsis sp. CA-161197 TaxID=3239922 RepID=UPI003D8A0B77
MPETPHTIIDVHIILERDDLILLTEHKGTYGNGMWHLPSGKLEHGESLPHGAAREALEEVGVEIDQADLRIVYTIYVTGPGPDARLGFFFATDRWTGESVNRERGKCSEITWFPRNALPSAVIEYPLTGIHGSQATATLSILSWDEERAAGCGRHMELLIEGRRQAPV